MYVIAMDIIRSTTQPRTPSSIVIPTIQLKPIIKWAGGKRGVMNQLVHLFPTEFNNYHEPFLGGGSVALHLHNSGKLTDKQVFLSDSMKPLIGLYTTIKDDLQNLLLELKKPCYTNDKDSFMKCRDEYNRIKMEEHVKVSALFVYLNKTCFNGLYRENKLGEYNVPFGSFKNPSTIDEQHATNISTWLNQSNVHVSCCDYTNIEHHVQCGDFIYMDPPYYNTFNGYSKNVFGHDEQIQLFKCVERLTSIGCKVAMSNSNDPIIRDLYSSIPNVKFHEIQVKRPITSKSIDRTNIYTELLVTNY